MDVTKLSTGITAFIDILGFGSSILNANTPNDLIDLEKRINVVRDTFEHDRKDDVQKILQKSVLAFSDSVIIHVPFESEATKYSGTFDPIISEIHSIALSQGICVLNNVFIRGAVDMGWWYHNESILLSRSLSQAYKMESSCVKYPVIALTEELFEYFSKHKDRTTYAEEIDPIRLFRKTTVNQKEIYYIDYISASLDSIYLTNKQQADSRLIQSSNDRESYRQKCIQENIDSFLIDHARCICNQYSHAKSDDVKEKYVWLAQYHNEIREIWTSNTNCSVVLN